MVKPTLLGVRHPHHLIRHLRVLRRGRTKGRSAADIDLLYQRKVPARKFRLTEVSAERDATS